MAERKAPTPSPSSATRASRSAGLGTGILIGILLGIGMALAVAVWLNVRGSPFSERDAPAELPSLKLPAPATDGVSNQPARTPPSPAVAGAPADAAPSEAEAGRNGQRFDFYEILPGSDPAAAPQPRINLPVSLFLQAGAFRSASDADDRKAQLNLLGQTAVVQRVQTGDSLLHRIRVGPFATPAELDRAREFLKSNGIDSISMRPEASVSQ